jgi:hypothetical protein
MGNNTGHEGLQVFAGHFVTEFEGESREDGHGECWQHWTSGFRSQGGIEGLRKILEIDKYG